MEKIEELKQKQAEILKNLARYGINALNEINKQIFEIREQQRRAKEQARKQQREQQDERTAEQVAELLQI